MIMTMKLNNVLLSATLCVIAMSAAPVVAQTYIVDPTHTFPSFEADHFGASYWRGKFNKSKGKIVLDRVAKTGSIDITIDTASIDFGLEAMNAHARDEDIFDVKKFPTATFKSTDIKFEGDKPSAVEGNFTLRGITKPITLRINRFKCFTHPVIKKESCGADASATIQRTDFDMNYAINLGFSPEVKLSIQVEAIRAE